MTKAESGLSESQARRRWVSRDGRTGASFFPLSALEVSSGAFSFINQKVAVRWRRMTRKCISSPPSLKLNMVIPLYKSTFQQEWSEFGSRPNSRTIPKKNSSRSVHIREMRFSV